MRLWILTVMIGCAAVASAGQRYSFNPTGIEADTIDYWSAELGITADHFMEQACREGLVAHTSARYQREDVELLKAYEDAPDADKDEVKRRLKIDRKSRQ